ncbi:MAG: S24 family peptidase, partial [Actinobacteria bacterium]
MRRALAIVAGLAAVAGWFFLVRPVALGGPTGYVMVRGVSMNPKYHSYDLVLTRHQSRYHPGDIVAYHVPKGQPGEGIIV